MDKPVVSIIVAMSENRVIGNKGEIPWHIVEDLQRFRSLTNNRTIIVGRTTFELICEAYRKRNKPMPDRNTVILTNNKNYKTAVPGTYIVGTLDEAFTIAKKIEAEEIFISGGAKVFEQALPFADRLLLTIVHTTVEGDAYFPEYDHIFTRITDSRDSSGNGYTYSFITVEK